MRLAALLLFLVYVSLVPTLWLIPAAAIALSRPALLARAALILPFSVTLSLAAAPERAVTLLAKSYLSALGVVIFAVTTPVPVWTATLRSWHVPSTLIITVEFLHRYLGVLTGEARTMSTAARARGGFRFTAAAGAIGVLFARSWHRAESIHRAMLARGYPSS